MKKFLALCVVMSTVIAGTALADTPSQLKFMAGPPGGNWFALGGELDDGIVWHLSFLLLLGGVITSLTSQHQTNKEKTKK